MWVGKKRVGEGVFQKRELGGKKIKNIYNLSKRESLRLKLKLLAIPPNIIRNGSDAEENEHADRDERTHKTAPIIRFYLHVWKYA